MINKREPKVFQRITKHLSTVKTIELELLLLIWKRGGHGSQPAIKTEEIKYPPEERMLPLKIGTTYHEFWDTTNLNCFTVTG